MSDMAKITRTQMHPCAFSSINEHAALSKRSWDLKFQSNSE